MFGKRLAYLRGDKTQEEVAKALGLSRARYAHYEQGRSEPSLELLEKMADYFDVSVGYLLGRTNDPEEYVSLDSPEIRAIARKLKNASPQKLDLFHKLVDSMAEEAEAVNYSHNIEPAISIEIGLGHAHFPSLIRLSRLTRSLFHFSHLDNKAGD